jgi:hypothetical protein
MSDRTNDRWTRRLWVGLAGGSALIYVAGIGPASRLDAPGWRTLYRPVFALGVFRPIGRPLAAYLNLWIPWGSRATYVYEPDDGLYYDCGFTLDPTPGTSR